ncbi:hypothetical protein L1987_13098 [Smallanthus sonchifolius]|uniref:Uncharacterized protein n=1 Tax=Smallanthus sonchifolius TaxID=185202 RepID=A0ACB9JGL6_9ASTR|nr:hypothetical protein L1987_13098 [Smallanthus sonchifolius]
MGLFLVYLQKRVEQQRPPSSVASGDGGSQWWRFLAKLELQGFCSSKMCLQVNLESILHSCCLTKYLFSMECFEVRREGG